ncbi:MAG: chromate transporter [Alphaproteobacteria bacterium]|nr:chromate transporter [Alphaproteobacteria bacterium]
MDSGGDERGEAAGGTEAREPALPDPSLAGLFLGFLTVGLLGFGGVLPIARRMIIEDKRWMTAAEFADLLGLCQFLPGGNVINLSVAVGFSFRGSAGAAAALLGLVTMPGAIVIALGILYTRFQDDPQVRHVFAGLAATAAGLLIATAVKLALPLRDKPVRIGIALLCFGAVAILRLPLVPTLIVLAPFSMLVIRLTRG